MLFGDTWTKDERLLKTVMLGMFESDQTRGRSTAGALFFGPRPNW